MLTVAEIEQNIRVLLNRYHAEYALLFGSYARGTANENSDIDLLVDLSGTEIKSLLQLSAVMLELEQATGKKIDLITTSSFQQKANHPSTIRFRDTVNHEKRVL